MPTPIADNFSQLRTGSADELAYWRPPHALALVLITLFALPLLLVHLGSAPSHPAHELANVVSIQDALHLQPHWVPTVGGESQPDQPPLPVWLAAGWARLRGSESLGSLRFPAVILGLLTCYATYGLGSLTSRDRRLGLFAALILATSWLFLREATQVACAIHATAFLTISLFGLLGMVERPQRRWMWIPLTGIALGLSLLSASPWTTVALCLAWLVWGTLTHRGRWDVYGGFLAASAIALLVIGPWLLAVRRFEPAAWHAWIWAFLPGSALDGVSLRGSFWQVTQFLLLPWTPAFLAGMLLPFLPTRSAPPPTDSERKGRWLFWLIALGSLLMFCVFRSRPQHVTMQYLPAASLVTAAVWVEFVRLRRNVKFDAGAWLLLLAQAGVILGSGLGILAGLLFIGALPGVWATQIAKLPTPYATFLASHTQNLTPVLRFFGWGGWALLGLVLLALGGLLWQSQVRRRFDRAFAIQAFALWLLMLSVCCVYRVGPGRPENPSQADGAALQQLTAGQRIYMLPADRPSLDVLYFAHHIGPPRTSDELIALARADNSPIFLIARLNEPYDSTVAAIAVASQRTADPLYLFHDGHYPRVLYRLTPVEEPANPMPIPHGNPVP